MPIVGVKDDRSWHQSRKRGDRSKREKSKASRIVGIVDGVLAVDPRSIEVIEMFYEEHLGSRPRTCNSENPGFLGVGTHVDQEWLTNRLEVGISVPDGSIERQNSSDIETGSSLEVGQTTDSFG